MTRLTTKARRTRRNTKRTLFLLLLPFAFCFLPFAFSQDSRFVLVIQFPPDQKIRLPFFRTGALDKIDAEGEVRRKKT
ncbi:MAG: hypothetical protein ACREVW_04875, partial [Burkholderiales bacterium]